MNVHHSRRRRVGAFLAAATLVAAACSSDKKESSSTSPATTAAATATTTAAAAATTAAGGSATTAAGGAATTTKGGSTATTKAGSTPAAASTPAGPPAQEGGTLRVRVPADPSSLDPQAGPSGGDHQMLYPMYDTLITFDPATMKPLPNLAKSWEYTDPTTLTLKLRTA